MTKKHEIEYRGGDKVHWITELEDRTHEDHNMCTVGWGLVYRRDYVKIKFSTVITETSKKFLSLSPSTQLEGD